MKKVVKVYTIGKGKKNFTDIEWKGNNILVFGSEGFGMHQHTSKYTDFLLKIDIDEIPSTTDSADEPNTSRHSRYPAKDVELCRNQTHHLIGDEGGAVGQHGHVSELEHGPLP